MKNLSSVWKKYSYMILITFIIAGMFNRKIALIAIICMVAPLVFALLGRGRYWCGNLCPRGNFYDNVISRISYKKPVPKFLKSNIFRALVIVFMFYMFGTGLYKSWGDTAGVGMVFYRMIVVTTIVGIILGAMYSNRTWCNFCPMGTLSAFISYFKKDRQRLSVGESCISCKLCEKACPMGIVPYEYKGNKLEHPDCIQCGKCITSCPKKCILPN